MQYVLPFSRSRVTDLHLCQPIRATPVKWTLTGSNSAHINGSVLHDQSTRYSLAGNQRQAAWFPFQGNPRFPALVVPKTCGAAAAAAHAFGFSPVCAYDDLELPNGTASIKPEQQSSITSGCSPGDVSTGKCMFEKSGLTCLESRCSNGVWTEGHPCTVGGLGFLKFPSAQYLSHPRVS